MKRPAPLRRAGATSPPARPGALLEAIWYGRHPAGLLLAPLGWLWAGVAEARAALHRSGLLPVVRLPVPVIVVGNLTVGGTGKTPLTIWIARWAREQGLAVGVVSRGYGGRASVWPQQVRADSDPAVVGDEALVIARHTGAPMAVGPDRVEAARALIERHRLDLIVADDGLQHYALGRDVEIAVVDGVRRHGNGRCLPAGPLREWTGRLERVDFRVANGLAGRGEFAMRCVPRQLVPLRPGGRPLPPTTIAGQRVHCVAGIGHPERFFQTVRALGARVVPHAFPDHHRYVARDLDFGDEDLVLMTEKDAVKCERLAGAAHWFLEVEAELPEAFGLRLAQRIGELRHGRQAARDPRLPRDQGPPHPRPRGR